MEKKYTLEEVILMFEKKISNKFHRFRSQN